MRRPRSAGNGSWRPPISRISSRRRSRATCAHSACAVSMQDLMECWPCGQTTSSGAQGARQTGPNAGDSKQGTGPEQQLEKHPQCRKETPSDKLSDKLNECCVGLSRGKNQAYFERFYEAKTRLAKYIQCFTRCFILFVYAMFLRCLLIDRRRTRAVWHLGRPSRTAPVADCIGVCSLSTSHWLRDLPL